MHLVNKQVDMKINSVMWTQVWMSIRAKLRHDIYKRSFGDGMVSQQIWENVCREVRYQGWNS